MKYRAMVEYKAQDHRPELCSDTETECLLQSRFRMRGASFYWRRGRLDVI